MNSGLFYRSHCRRVEATLSYVDPGPGVRINVIEPAAIETDTLKIDFAGKPDLYQQLEKRHLQMYIGRPEQVSQLAIVGGSIDGGPKKSGVTIGLAFALLCLLGALFATPLSAYAEWSYLESWKVHPDYKGLVPKKSDVIFSTRFKRDEAPEVARAFGATRIEWVYSSDAQYIQRLREAAPWFGGAVSSTIPLKDDQGVARDIEGNPIVAPWMKSWGAKWITVSNEGTRAELRRLATSYIKAGASSIQVDDPLLQFGARWWGADFSASSIKGFRNFLLKHPDRQLIKATGLEKPNIDYREFLVERYGIHTAQEYAKRQRDLPSTPIWHAYLKESVLSHFADFKNAIDSAAGKRVPISMNLLLFGPDEKRDEFALVPFADYAMVETKIDDYDVVTLQAATYRALGMGFVPSILPVALEENRAAIASLYALGGQPLVPWDVYINQGPDSKPTRFFGAPEDYSALYQFVRRNADIFDGFEGLPVVGILAPVSHYDLKNTLALVQRLNRANVPFALVPVGGSYGIDTSRLTHLRLLVSVNPLADIGQDNLSVIEGAGVELVNAEHLNDIRLHQLSPFKDLSMELTRVVIRGNTEGQSALAIHMLPLPNAKRSRIDGECEGNLSIKNNFLDNRRVSDAVLRTSKGRAQVLFEQGVAALTLKIPLCGSWGVALVSLSEKLKK